ncbi:MAG: hypothetical protein AAGA23_07725 [Pseudomonadota bacterium]
MNPSASDKLRSAWKQAAESESTAGGAGPGPNLDRQIRRHARQVLKKGPPSPGWIWPASAAASVVLCTSLMLQMARYFQPPTPPPDSYQPRYIKPLPPRDVSVGESTAVSDAPVVLDLETVAPRVDSPEFWWEELRRNAANADREAFLATWHAYRRHLVEAPLPEDLKQWVAQNNIVLPAP